MRQLIPSLSAFLLLGFVPFSSLGAQDAPGPFRVSARDVPADAVATVESDLAWSREKITETFGPFPEPIAVGIYPDRETFSAALSEAWGIPETACWMVGAADDHHLYLLSPSAWAAEACEHDPSDAGHRRRLVAHEAVHVYHGQVNPSPDIGLLEDVGWFVEGLATYVSGQLEAEHAGRAAEAIAAGSGPGRLADAWTGPYRYGVAGSLAAYIDAEWGRDVLSTALTAQTTDELLGLLGVSEEEFLAGWEARVLAS